MMLLCWSVVFSVQHHLTVVIQCTAPSSPQLSICGPFVLQVGVYHYAISGNLGCSACHTVTLHASCTPEYRKEKELEKSWRGLEKREKYCLQQVRMGEEEESGRTVISCMQFYRGGFRRICLPVEGHTETESKSGSEQNQESQRQQETAACESRYCCQKEHFIYARCLL